MQLVEYGFGRSFHDVIFFDVGDFNFIFIFLEFIVYFRASSQDIVESHQFNVIVFVF